MGKSLSRAAETMELDHEIVDIDVAYRSTWISEKLNWHLLGKRPAHINLFNRALIETAEQFQPDVLISTGIAPISQKTLKTMSDRGIICINYQTDDPWNPAHRTHRFLQALPYYHNVFYPRHSTGYDLEHLCTGRCHYLPFAYDPDLFFIEDSAKPHAVDLGFVGAAESFRASCLGAAANAGMSMNIYGSGWDTYSNLRTHARGTVGGEQVRATISDAAINPCFVRRSNRDGHCMRTYEIPAAGGCILAERTEEHETILGAEGDTATYFSSAAELVEKTDYLLNHPQERETLARNLHVHITSGGNTYQDRLNTMLETVGC